VMGNHACCVLYCSTLSSVRNTACVLDQDFQQGWVLNVVQNCTSLLW